MWGGWGGGGAGSVDLGSIWGWGWGESGQRDTERKGSHGCDSGAVSPSPYWGALSHPPPVPPPFLPPFPPPISPPAIRIKKPIKTKFRLPVFNWTALKPNQISGTVFSELDDERVLQVGGDPGPKCYGVGSGGGGVALSAPPIIL